MEFASFAEAFIGLISSLILLAALYVRLYTDRALLAMRQSIMDEVDRKYQRKAEHGEFGWQKS